MSTSLVFLVHTMQATYAQWPIAALILRLSQRQNAYHTSHRSGSVRQSLPTQHETLKELLVCLAAG